MSNSHPLAETFSINNRINLYLLNAIEQEHLKDVSASKGRNVGEQFAHIHNVRLMWLKASAPELLEGLNKIEKENALDKKTLGREFENSSKAIEDLLKQGEATGKIKGFKPHATAFLGYLLAHEAHHRGQIILSLKQNNHMIDKKVQFGIWEWGTR
jgi:uncharacterized damage-inducible protein DinB